MLQMFPHNAVFPHEISTTQVTVRFNNYLQKVSFEILRSTVSSSDDSNVIMEVECCHVFIFCLKSSVLKRFPKKFLMFKEEITSI